MGLLGHARRPAYVAGGGVGGGRGDAHSFAAAGDAATDARSAADAVAAHARDAARGRVWLVDAWKGGEGVV